MTSSNQYEVTLRSLRAGVVSAGKIVLDQDWKSFTPVLSTGALNAAATSVWRYRIVGRSLHIQAYYSALAAGTTGAGTYNINLPTGCTAQFANQACGQAIIAGATKQFIGVVGVSPGSLTQFSVFLVDPLSGTSTIVNWGSTADAEIRLGAAAMSVSLAFQIELSASSPALQG